MSIDTNGIPTEEEILSGISAGCGIWHNPKSKVTKQACKAAAQHADENCEECSGNGTLKAWCGNNANPEIWVCGCLSFTSEAQRRRFNSTFKFDNKKHN